MASRASPTRRADRRPRVPLHALVLPWAAAALAFRLVKWLLSLDVPRDDAWYWCGGRGADVLFWTAVVGAPLAGLTAGLLAARAGPLRAVAVGFANLAVAAVLLAYLLLTTIGGRCFD
jgi:hypothetical protein